MNLPQNIRKGAIAIDQFSSNTYAISRKPRQHLSLDECPAAVDAREEVFTGWTLERPEGMKESKPVYGFQYVCQIEC